jgi:hypothetical protein
VRIAEMLKNILVEKNPLDLSVRILLPYRYKPTEIVEVFRTQEFDSLQVKQEIDKLNIRDNSKLFEFDFFVIQSKHDAGWVDCFVLHQSRGFFSTSIFFNISAMRTWSSVNEMSLKKRIKDHMCLTWRL